MPQAQLRMRLALTLVLKASGAAGIIFDVTVFNPNAPPYQKLQLAAKQLMYMYEQRICEVELGSSIPLGFSTSGSMSKSTAVAYNY